MMTLSKALSRVCDDAERHLSAGLQGQDPEGWEAIKVVRALKIEVDWSEARGVIGEPKK